MLCKISLLSGWRNIAQGGDCTPQKPWIKTRNLIPLLMWGIKHLYFTTGSLKRRELKRALK